MRPSVTRVVKFLRRGASVSRADVEYAKSSSSTTAPTSGWQTTAPAWENGKYIWTRTHTFYDDGSSTYSIPVCLPSGKGISSIIEQYYLSDSATEQIGGSWSATAPTWQDGKYIWTRSLITYTDNSTVTTSPVCATGHKGDKGDDSVVYTLKPNYPTLLFHSDGNSAAYTPASFTLRCGYIKTVGDVRTVYDYPSGGTFGSYYLLYRRIQADGTPVATFAGDQPYGWDWIDNNNTGEFKDGNGNLVVPSSTNRIAIDFAVTKQVPRTCNDTTDVLAIIRVPIYKLSDGDKGDKGDTGSRGPALRGPQAWNDCATGYAFKQGAEGEAYVDVVLYNGYYYMCKKSHTKAANNYPGSTIAENQGLWELGDSIGLVATKILLSEYALVKNLGVEFIDMKDGQGNILFQAKNGAVTCKTGSFEGITVTDALIKRQRNPFTPINGSFTALDDDTMYTPLYLSGYVYITLGWDVTQAGRRITVLGSAAFQAPTDSTQHYYLDGKEVQTFLSTREITELVGWGTASEFYGWVVVGRHAFRTTYFQGRQLDTVAYGTVQGTGSGVSFVQKRIGYSGDGDIYVTRSAVGVYFLWVPLGWFYSADYLHCMVCGRGNNRGSGGAADTGPVYAQVYGVTTDTYDGTFMYRIEIHVADDNTENDGGFYFELKNYGAWDDHSN